MTMPTLTAFYHRTGVIEATLSKTFYRGVSSLFRLYDQEGNSTSLTILSQKETPESVLYELKTEPLDVTLDYKLADAHHLTTIVQMGRIVREPWFDEKFAYKGTDLGATYLPQSTEFKVWAPTASNVNLLLKTDKKEFVYYLDKGPKGVWSIKVLGDLDGAFYRYVIRINGQWREAIDPYGYSSSANHEYSAVINPFKAQVDLKKDRLTPMISSTEAILYELHIRDFSMHSSGNMKFKGKYKAFLEKETTTPVGHPTGMDYLANLGFTHVQLLPMYDFGSVNEQNQLDYYNWGYDPVQFSVPEGSYATDVKNPLTRMIEAKQMIAAFHQRGIRVVMDVVYNHMFDLPSSSFHQIVPYYYFRYDENGTISNGSFCGNDFDSTRAMASQFIVDSCVRWAKDYGIDGFRFDLMGIIDIATMQKVVKACRAIDPSFIVYGEGWNMPTFLPDNQKTSQQNNHLTPSIGFFSDRFRESIKGNTSHHEIDKRGYATGDNKDLNLIKDVLTGSCTDLGLAPFYQSPQQVVNYTECHDNSTLWDKITISNAQENDETKIKRQKLILAITLVAQGIPFIHAGQEFLRTKKGDHNSYMSPDSVNQLDWQRMDRYYDVVLFTKDLIQLRKNLPELRLSSAAEIKQRVSFETLENGALLMQIKPLGNSLYEDIKILINPTLKVIHYRLLDYYQVLANEAGMPKFDLFSQNLMVNPVTLVVVVLPKKQHLPE